MTAMRLKRYPSPSGGFALGKMGVGATMMKRLPYDAEVEYLESTGTQYIDTGVIFKTQPRVVFDWLVTDGGDKDICGTKRADAGCFLIDIYLNNDPWLWYRYGTSGLSGYASMNKPNVNSRHTMDAGRKVLLDGVQILSLSGTYDFSTNSQTLLLFRGRTYHKARIYSFIVYDNEALVRDMIPVRFTNELGQSEGAMYDRVSEQLYRNQGTGVFPYGNDI